MNKIFKMNIHNLIKYFRVWKSITLAVAQQQLLTSWGGLAFVFGKIARFALFFIFIASILQGGVSLAGYSQAQVITFFLVFNIIDTTAQLLFRGVYMFRNRVIQGTFDLDLLKPLPSYFRPLFGSTDILDALLLPPLVIFTFYYTITQQVLTSTTDFFLFLLMFTNAILVAFSFHLIVIAMGILTTEIDHLVQVYRDLTSIARFPTDIYARSIQFILTFTIPVVILITVPAKSLIGDLTPTLIATSFSISLIFLFTATRLWKFALSRYTSASS